MMSVKTWFHLRHLFLPHPPTQATFTAKKTTHRRISCHFRINPHVCHLHHPLQSVLMSRWKPQEITMKILTTTMTTGRCHRFPCHLHYFHLRLPSLSHHLVHQVSRLIPSDSTSRHLYCFCCFPVSCHFHFIPMILTHHPHPQYLSPLNTDLNGLTPCYPEKSLSWTLRMDTLDAKSMTRLIFCNCSNCPNCVMVLPNASEDQMNCPFIWNVLTGITAIQRCQTVPTESVSMAYVTAMMASEAKGVIFQVNNSGVFTIQCHLRNQNANEKKGDVVRFWWKFCSLN